MCSVKKWRAVVFDLDDTLYPERQYVLSGFAAVAAWVSCELGIASNTVYQELAALFFEGVRGDTFDRWVGRRALPATLVPELVKVYRQHTPALSAFPGIPDLVGRLRRRCLLGIVTDGYLEVQKKKLAALGLGQLFHAVVYSDQWGREAWKPSVQPFQVVLRQLGVLPEDAVYVADNPAKDFLGARRAGMSSIRLRHLDGEYSQMDPPSAAHAPDYVVETVADLSDLLDERTIEDTRSNPDGTEP